MKRLSQLFLILSAGLICLLGCGSVSPKEQKSNQPSSSSTTEQPSDSASAEESLAEEGIQQIGNEEVGYVYVPADWTPFKDLAGGESYQYSATDAYTIITMFSYDKETLGVEVIDDAAAEQAANSYAYSMDESGLYDSLTGAKAQIAGYEAYQVYANAKSDGKLICAWIFVTEAKDKVYLVSLEGQQSDETYQTALAYIEASWSAQKE